MAGTICFRLKKAWTIILLTKDTFTLQGDYFDSSTEYPDYVGMLVWSLVNRSIYASIPMILITEGSRGKVRLIVIDLKDTIIY